MDFINSSIGYIINISPSICSVDCAYCHKTFENAKFFHNNQPNVDSIKASLNKHWVRCTEWQRINRPPLVYQRQTRAAATKSFVIESEEAEIDQQPDCDNNPDYDNEKQEYSYLSNDVDDAGCGDDIDVNVCDSTIHQIILESESLSAALTSSQRVFEIQNIISETFFTGLPPLYTRRKVNNNCDVLDWHDYTAIADWGTQVGISEAEGDRLLLLFRNMLGRHGLGNELYKNSGHSVRGLHIPAQYDNIVHAVGKHSASFNRVFNTRLKLDIRYWGEVEQDGSPLKQPTCVYFDLLERIASKCLELKDLSNFIMGYQSKPEVDSFFSAEFAKETDRMMKSKYGEQLKTVDGVEIVPFYLIFSDDEAALNQTKNVAADVCVWSSPNFCGNAKFVELLGFTPNGDLGRSQEELHFHLLTVMGCATAVERASIIKRTKRDVYYQYYKCCLASIIALEERGFNVQLGMGDHAKQIVAIPVLVMFPGDGKAQNAAAGISIKMKGGRRCRVCLNHISDLPGVIARIRDPVDTARMLAETNRLEVEESLASRGKSRRVARSAANSLIFKSAANQNLIPGENFLYSIASCRVDYCKTHSEFEHSVLRHGFCIMTPSDELHCMLKGIIEHCISWVMVCLYLLQRLYPSLFSSLVKDVDIFFKYFPLKQTILPYVCVDMRKGISELWPETRAIKGKGTRTGGFVGSVPAIRLPGILWRLMLAISGEGITKRQMSTGSRKSGNSSSESPFISLPTEICLGEDDNSLKYNFRCVCLSAMQDCLTLVNQSRNKSFRPEDFEDLSSTVGHSLASIRELNKMRFHMYCKRKGIFNQQIPMELTTKHHALSHLVFFIRLYGPSSIFDTQISEAYHKIIKRLFETTTKNVRSRNLEIATKLSKRNCIDLLSDLSDRFLAIPEAAAVAATTGLTTVAASSTSKVPIPLAKSNELMETEETQQEYGAVSFAYVFNPNAPKHLVTFNCKGGGGVGKFQFSESKSDRFNARLAKELLRNNDECGTNFVSQYHHPLFNINSFDEFILNGYLCKRWIQHILRWVQKEKLSSAEARPTTEGKEAQMKKRKTTTNFQDAVLCEECRVEDHLCPLITSNFSPVFDPCLYAFSQVTFVGYEGMPSFIIQCDQSSIVNRREHIEQRALIPAFGYLFVSWDGVTSYLVKVICILRFVETKSDLFASIDNSKEKKSGHNILIVVILRKIEPNSHSPRGPFPYSIYEYERERAGVTNHAIEFSKVIAPACVIPYYTKQSTPEDSNSRHDGLFYLISKFPDTNNQDSANAMEATGGGGADDDSEVDSTVIINACIEDPVLHDGNAENFLDEYYSGNTDDDESDLAEEDYERADEAAEEDNNY